MLSSTWHHPAVSATFKSQNFFFWLKNKRPLTLSRTFPHLLFSLQVSSDLVTCLTLYKEDQATHQGAFSLIPLSSPIIWNSFHFAVISLKISISFFISFTKSLFIDNNTTHILQLTIIHYLSFSHSIILKYHHLATHKHIPIFFSIFSCNTSLLRKQHNQCHNTKNNPSSSLYYI